MNARFLETSLANLRAHDSAVRDPSIEAALQSDIPIAAAAEALLSGIRSACLDKLMRGLKTETGEATKLRRFAASTPNHRPAETTPRGRREAVEVSPVGGGGPQRGGKKETKLLSSVTDRPLKGMPDLPDAIQAFLHEHPDTDWQVTEVVTHGDPTQSHRLRNFEKRLYIGSPLNLMGIDHLYGKKEVFEWMHPKGSRIVRHLPLQFLLWDETYRSGEGCVGVQFMSERCSLDELARLLDRRTRPVLLKIPNVTAEPGYYGSALLHDGTYDELKAFVHDIYHLRRWNEIPPAQRWPLQRNIVALYSVFTEVLHSQPPEIRNDPAVLEACDELLSGPTYYPALPDPYRVIFGSMDVYLRRLPGDACAEIWEAFHQRRRGSTSSDELS